MNGGKAVFAVREEKSMKGDTGRLKFQQVTDAAPWSARYGPSAVVFRDRLWLIGGFEAVDGARMNDVWTTADGVRWERVLSQAPWTPRCASAVYAIEGKLWLVGGLGDVNPIKNPNDIWVTENGADWTCVTADAPWVARHVFGACVHHNRMYLAAGATSGQLYHNDVHYSQDGVQWASPTVRNDWFTKRKCHSLSSCDDRLWLLGGSVVDPSNVELGGSRMLNDVWSSPNGAMWQQVCAEAPWKARAHHDSVAYHDRLWLLCGHFGRTHYASDIWTTSNGIDWHCETDQVAWPLRHANGVAVFRDKIWILGGTSDSWGKISRRDIWTVEET